MDVFIHALLLPSLTTKILSWEYPALGCRHPSPSEISAAVNIMGAKGQNSGSGTPQKKEAYRPPSARGRDTQSASLKSLSLRDDESDLGPRKIKAGSGFRGEQAGHIYKRTVHVFEATSERYRRSFSLQNLSIYRWAIATGRARGAVEECYEKSKTERSSGAKEGKERERRFGLAQIYYMFRVYVWTMNSGS